MSPSELITYHLWNKNCTFFEGVVYVPILYPAQRLYWDVSRAPNWKNCDTHKYNKTFYEQIYSVERSNQWLVKFWDLSVSVIWSQVKTSC